jgi:nitrite reductase/ring-hydroxylating ferredoxin subunit/alkylhydroperoxidase/carboxymuconolactone decarboxylase family protein YurZ
MSTADEPVGREFLSKVRPKAMEHLLAFFRESATHLDPKTRFLISVVTKTINFSPRGLKQYVKKAMEAGATKDEVIDAILCAYPCAGLTKVADAAGVLLEMGFDAETAPAADWFPVEGASALAEGHGGSFTANGVKIFVARHQGALRALEDVCPHRGGALSEGDCEGGVVTCPLHGWQFKVEDGSSGGVGRGGAKALEMRESGGKAEVRIPGA